MTRVEEESLWERDDEVYKVLKVYDARQSDGKGNVSSITLVKHILVEPMPWHCEINKFLDKYEPYDPEAE